MERHGLRNCMLKRWLVATAVRNARVARAVRRLRMNGRCVRASRASETARREDVIERRVLSRLKARPTKRKHARLADENRRHAKSAKGGRYKNEKCARYDPGVVLGREG